MGNIEIQNLSCWHDGVFYQEQFRAISGFDGNYEISNFGRIKSNSRKLKRDGYEIIIKEKLLKVRINPNGYLMISFTYLGKVNTFLVHRLVALVFLPNPENKRTINHKFGNKKDNRAWMLEWNTHKENVDHSYKLGMSKNVFGEKASRATPISQFDLNGNFIRDWWGAKEAETAMGYSRSYISNNLKGICKNAHGFIWKYKNP